MRSGVINIDLLSEGKIISVRGSVVDVWFDYNLPRYFPSCLPEKKKKISIEVLTHSNSHTVRGIAFNPTEGLSRGMPAFPSGGELTVPVGPEIMGRMFDVFGNTIDQGSHSANEAAKHSQAPPSLEKRSTKSEIFITGIKAIDILIPLERGGKAGLFGGAGVGKTVLLTEMIHNMVGTTKA